MTEDAGRSHDPSSAPRTVLIVGASAAGLSVAQHLRALRFDGSIAVIGEETGTPYDRPPLTKQVLSGLWAPERANLLSEQRLSALDVDLLLGSRAVSLDCARREVHLDSGQSVGYEALVIATGARPRRLPGVAHGSTRSLRTLDDALRIKRRLLNGSKLVVIGAGFLGLELAATARALGVSVSVLELATRPLDARLGASTADRLMELHLAHGVDVHTGATAITLTEPTPENARRTVGVAWDGGEVEADLVVEAIGCVPDVGWLESSGLELADGVVCDEYCATAPSIWAVGDVARWWHPHLKVHLRLENRTNATEQARAVAENILGRARAYSPTPYFWTDQYSAKIQVVGVLPPDASETTVADTSEATITEFWDEGRLAAVVGWNSPRAVTRYRQTLALGAEEVRQ